MKKKFDFEFIYEDKPLGTAGSLKRLKNQLIKILMLPLMVVNQ